MPRKGLGSKVGGRRQGQAGTAYANRSDLNGPVPIRTAPGQPYGSAKQQEAAQQITPMGPPTTASGPAAPVAAAVPGGLTPLNAPSQRPNEPITSGLPMGAGPGPEVLASSPRRFGTTELSRLAAESGDPFLTALAMRARSMR